jgi:hypothetical protein
MSNAKKSAEIESMKMLSDVGRYAAEENSPVFARVDGKELVIMTADTYADLIDERQKDATSTLSGDQMKDAFDLG